MDQLAKEEGAPGGPVLTVDHSRGWVSDPKLPNTLTVDWAHPDAAGDERRARRLHTPA